MLIRRELVCSRREYEMHLSPCFLPECQVISDPDVRLSDDTWLWNWTSSWERKTESLISPIWRLFAKDSYPCDSLNLRSSFFSRWVFVSSKKWLKRSHMNFENKIHILDRVWVDFCPSVTHDATVSSVFCLCVFPVCVCNSIRFHRKF